MADNKELFPDIGESLGDEPEVVSTDYVARTRTDAPEEVLTEIANQEFHRSRPLRLRIAISLFDSVRRQYLAWRGQIWKIDLHSAEAAKEVRQILELVEEGLRKEGAKGFREKLEGMVREKGAQA